MSAEVAFVVVGVLLVATVAIICWVTLPRLLARECEPPQDRILVDREGVAYPTTREVRLRARP